MNEVQAIVVISVVSAFVGMGAYILGRFVVGRFAAPKISFLGGAFLAAGIGFVAVPLAEGFSALCVWGAALVLLILDLRTIPKVG